MDDISTDGPCDSNNIVGVQSFGRSKLDARLCRAGDNFEESGVLRMPRPSRATPCLSKIIEAKLGNVSVSKTTGNIQADDAKDMKTFEIDSDNNLVVDLDNDRPDKLPSPNLRYFPRKDTELNNLYSGNQSGIKAIYPKSSERRADKLPVSISRSAFLATEYKMDHPKRGKALVVNNMRYADNRQRPEREDSIKDATAIASLLERLKFEPVKRKTGDQEEILVHNVSSTKLMELLKDAANPDVNDYSDCDCFVMVVLSYGINGAIMCCEGETDRLIPVEDVIGQFTADKCPFLAMKPKLFFMQLCPAFTYNIADSVRDTKAPSSKPSVQSIPTEADILCQISTIPGTYGWYADDDALSWYIEVLKESLERNLCEPLKQYRKSKDIMDILLCVNSLYLAKLREQGIRPSQSYSTPQITSTLTKQLYFMPKEGDLNL